MGNGPIPYIGQIEDGDYMLVVSANQQEHRGITGEGEARHWALNVGWGVAAIDGAQDLSKKKEK